MLKFVFGLDPWKATRGNLISPIIEVRSGQKYFGIEFPRSKQAVDVPIILQFTSDLKTWQSAISILNKMGDIDAQRERIQLMQTEPIGSGSKRYYRLIIPE
jgi:hypothetical protein